MLSPTFWLLSIIEYTSVSEMSQNTFKIQLHMGWKKRKKAHELWNFPLAPSFCAAYLAKIHTWLVVSCIQFRILYTKNHVVDDCCTLLLLIQWCTEYTEGVKESRSFECARPQKMSRFKVASSRLWCSWCPTRKQASHTKHQLTRCRSVPLT